MTLSTALETALNRIEDILAGDDAQAFKEARRFLPVGRDALAALRSMPAEPVAWQVRHFFPEQGDTEWTDWQLVSENNLFIWERRLKQMPDKYELRPLFATPHTEAKPAQDDVDAAIPLDKDELAQLIAEHLGGTYHCTRVWEAWNVGTMSQYDFKPVDESETPTEIADAIIDAIRAAISANCPCFVPLTDRA